jgi:hypothetical protein
MCRSRWRPATHDDLSSEGQPRNSSRTQQAAGRSARRSAGNVYQADPATLWTETGVTWRNQPPPAGTAVDSVTGSSAAWQEWTVTAHLRAQYAGTNGGLILQGSVEIDSTGSTQEYSSREGASPPELVLAWD